MSKAIDEIIQEAMRRGAFDNLRGEGKPLNLAEYFNTPEELRLAYSVLKNANIMPQEAELLKEVSALREALAVSADDRIRSNLRKQINDRLLKFNLLMEHRKK
jgi:hypothetical protein